MALIRGLYGVTLLGLLLELFACLPALAASKLQTFHIEAGDATLTLNEFSRQSSLQLLFDYNIVRGRRTHAVSGEFEPQAALQQMLTETGLVYDFVNDRTLAVTLHNHDDSGAGAAVAAASNGDTSRTRAADSQSVRHEGPGTSDLTTDPRIPVLEEVRITGTHVRGEDPVGEHVASYDREHIANSGAATVQEFLRTLPQTFGGGPTEDTRLGSEAQTNSGQGAGINLRGLGARSTLVLINGKRLALGGSAAEFADIENMPLSAVERIDVLSESASALYGADAVGGVVNFVMRDNFRGVETLIRGGTGTRNTLGEYLAAQTLGSRWDSGSGVISMEFYRRDALPASARRYATSDLAPLGGDNFNTPMSNPGTVVAGGRSYAIPHGQNGSGLNPSDFVPDTQNLSNRLEGYDLLPSQKRWSLYSSARQELTEGAHLFANAMLSQRDSIRRNPGVGAQLTVPGSNPFYTNPNGGTDPVTVDYNFLADLGPQTTDSLVTDTNITLGVDVNAGAAWKVSLYGNYAQDKANQFAGGLLNLAALRTALADPNPATAFNPFGDGSNTNPATLRSIAMGSRFYTDSKLRSADVTADGPIVNLPGGAIKLAVGAEHRNQVFDTVSTGNTLTAANSKNLSRSITAAFGEITVPVFGRDNGAAGLRRLELSVAGRYENYRGSGHATTPKLGMIWSPLETVSLRGTWGRSTRAPTLSDLNTDSNIVIPTVMPNGSPGAGLSRVLVESGNSPGLTIERARSWTAGLDIEPKQWLAGLSLSATYFNINFRDRIQAPAFNSNILSNPSFANLITRNPSAAQLESACRQGTFVALTGGSCLQFPAQAIVDLRVQNLQSVRTQGIDLNTKYEQSWPIGTLKLGLEGTYVFHFTQQEGPDAAALELLNTETNPLNLKIRANLSWQRRRWGATLGANFQNNYTDTASQPHRNVRSFITFDTQLRYEVAPYSAGVMQNTRVELNALNVFNVSPPFLNNQTIGIGYDQENADPYGRLLSIQVRKTW